MIIGAAPVDSARLFKEFDPRRYYVICADAGYETALKAGVKPDLIVGDFDSAKEPPAKGQKVKLLPAEKDVTDTMFAVMKGFGRGFRSFLLLGCLGGARFDHSLANLEVLQYIREHGGHGIIADRNTKIFLLHDEKLKMTGMNGAMVSVFPYNGGMCTVTYAGLKYPDLRRLPHGGEQPGGGGCGRGAGTQRHSPGGGRAVTHFLPLYILE